MRSGALVADEAATGAMLGPAQVRRHITLAAFSAVALLAFGLWLGAPASHGDNGRRVSDLVFILAPLIAAASCWSASRRDPSRRSGFAWMAVGCLTWASASVVWSVYELVLRDPAPFPSFADIGYIGYAVPVVIGVLRMPRTIGSLWSRLRFGLDALVIAASLLFASAVWVLQPVLAATSGGLFIRADAIAYPLVDVTVAAVVLTTSMVFSNSRRLGWMTFGLGLLVLAATDSTYVARTFAGHYAPGGLLDLGWTLSFLLVAVAAQTPHRATAPSTKVNVGEAPGLLQQLLPYGAVAAAAFAYSNAPMFRPHGQYFWSSCLLLTVVIARQLVVVADHSALTRDLARAVRRRTSELQDQEQWWRELVRNLSDVIIVVANDGTVRYCSPSVMTALGHWPKHVRTSEELRTQIHPADLQVTLAAIRPVLQGTKRQGTVECRIRRGDDSWGWFEVTARGQLTQEAVLDGAVLTLHDVSERRGLTDRLSHQAFHDALTRLPNRAMLKQRIEHRLTDTQDTRRFALLLIDLDDFKVINDSHGHEAGDLVLVEIGKRLASAVRAGDTVARLGGDEFAVLMNGTPDEVVATARRLTERIETYVLAGGRRFLVRASIGGIMADDLGGETADSLLSHADMALYEAKARDKGGVVVLDGAERQQAANQVRLREQIAHPQLDQFYVVYQPVVDLTSGHLRGVEALLRWRHPDLGEVSPADFIPLAEHGGSIQRLGWFVMESACRQLADWAAQWPEQRLGVGVNVSVLQLDEPGFAQRVSALIDEHHLQPDQLIVELTEQSLARDFETAVSVVAQLRAAGISVAVDDFGTGYSSLRYLDRFEADVLKIDRSFSAKLETSAHTQKIVRSVVQMSETLDMQSIAEGIETPAQLEIVRALGCELAQGFLFCRPVDPAEISRMLAERYVFPVSRSQPSPRVPAQLRPAPGDTSLTAAG